MWGKNRGYWQTQRRATASRVTRFSERTPISEKLKASVTASHVAYRKDAVVFFLHNQNL